MVAVRKPREPSFSSRMTVAEFLEWEGDDDGLRYQLVDGEPQAMAPSSGTHGALQVTAARLIENHLVGAGSACRALTEVGVVPRVASDTNFRVPDLLVTCVPDQPGLKIIPDPVLIVEILSPNNERDTWRNVWTYCSIPSIREILVLRVTEIGADLIRRQSDGNWPGRPEKLGPADEVSLESIGFRCCLADFYARTHLAQSA